MKRADAMKKKTQMMIKHSTRIHEAVHHVEDSEVVSHTIHADEAHAVDSDKILAQGLMENVIFAVYMGTKYPNVGKGKTAKKEKKNPSKIVLSLLLLTKMKNQLPSKHGQK